MEYPKSNELYHRALKSISGGLHSNSRNRSQHPIYMCQADGAYVTDLDGNRYVDLLMGNGSLLLGHNNPEFKRRMAAYMGNNGNLITGFDSPLSVEVAEKFCALTKHERVRFTNTGTEAIMHCLRIARAYTGRESIAVMEGAYNGWCDSVFVNSFAPLSAVGDEESPHPVPGTGGLDSRVTANTLVLPFNNIAASEKLIRSCKDDLAAIVLEAVMIDVGYIEARREYLQFLRIICDELGIVLVFDELLTGFRVSLGGCQEYFGISCDMSIFGKAFANGYIMAAVAGRAHIMDISAPGGKTAFIGTFNGHQVSLCAAAATLDMIRDGKITSTIIANTDYLRTGFSDLAKQVGIDAHLLGHGGHFQVYFTEKAPYNYRTAATSNPRQYAAYVNTLQENSVWCSQNPLSHHVLSAVHNRKVIDEVLNAMGKALLAAKKA